MSLPSSTSRPLYPWQAEPQRLWSLLDMLRFYAASFLAAWNNMKVMESEIPVMALQDNADFEPDVDWAEIQQRLRKTLADLAEACDKLPVSKTVVRQIERGSKEVQLGNDVLNHSTLTRLVDIRMNLVHELSDHYYLVIPNQRRGYYHNGGSTFGTVVENAFPDATDDIKAAHRCFALDEWTACVFHLMRGLELALHKWATELGVDQFSAIELENWKNILDAAERRIKAIEQQPKSAAKDQELTYYGETIGHFRAIKDAWRNHVAHARATYDEQRTITIVNHVREFMTLLAARS